MRKVRSVLVMLLAMALLIVVMAPAAFAGYLETESGYNSCGGYPMEVFTSVRADGPHMHTIVHSSLYVQDYGYTHYSYKYSNETAASWATSGGHTPTGYYSFASSGGFCRYDP